VRRTWAANGLYHSLRLSALLATRQPPRGLPPDPLLRSVWEDTPDETDRVPSTRGAIALDRSDPMLHPPPATCYLARGEALAGKQGEHVRATRFGQRPDIHVLNWFDAVSPFEGLWPCARLH
jgi:hypothetical protein